MNNKKLPEIYIYKYYSNRKLYDTNSKKISNQSEILKSLKKGRDIKVICNKTKLDITHHVLLQILMSELKESPDEVVKFYKILLLKDKKEMKKIKKSIEKIVFKK